MSSATSTDGGLRPWHLFVAVGMIGASVGVLLARDTRPANLVMISLTAMAAILAGIAFHRTLAPFSGADAEDDTPGLSAKARATLEREKTLVLRSIKELEFDRAMGKIADPDFADMSARLRARAIGLMKQLEDEQVGYRALVERDLQARLQSAGVDLTPARAGVGAAPSSSARRGAASAVATADPVECASCGAMNDHDARFCKKCGSKF